MKFYEDEEFILDGELIEDSRDSLDCFGEFNKNNIFCIKYCSESISCAVERGRNPGIDILEQILTMDFYQARMN